MATPTNQQMIDNVTTGLNAGLTSGISRHVTNGRDITRTDPMTQLDVLERLEARKARTSRRPFSKVVLRNVS
jgi:hypothetical protein